MKTIVEKSETRFFVVQNVSRKPEIALIFPITRNEDISQVRWRSVLNLVDTSKIDSLIVIDKTDDKSATRFFLENFKSASKNLYILPRCINESHYETLGEITLDDNLWVMQLHDDDKWNGYLELPHEIKPSAAYYSNFLVEHRSGKPVEILDFSMPARINFTLIPSYIWNQFTLMIKDQGFHVAASLDGTLNQMARLTCTFIPIPNFSYFYDNHNWEGSKSSKRSLKKLARNAGWGNWTSIEIALFNRQLDNLCSLHYVQGIAETKELELSYSRLMSQFKQNRMRRASRKVIFLTLKVQQILSKLISIYIGQGRMREELDSRLAREIFISRIHGAKDLDDVIDLIERLLEGKRFQNLENRFIFWNRTLTRLNVGCNR